MFDLFGNRPYHCKLCGKGLKELPCPPSELCRNCYRQALTYRDSALASIGMLEQKANAAGRANDSSSQARYLDQLLSLLLDYQSSYVRKGIPLFHLDLEQTIDMVSESLEIARAEARGERLSCTDGRYSAVLISLQQGSPDYEEIQNMLRQRMIELFVFYLDYGPSTTKTKYSLFDCYQLYLGGLTTKILGTEKNFTPKQKLLLSAYAGALRPDEFAKNVEEFVWKHPKFLTTFPLWISCCAVLDKKGGYDKTSAGNSTHCVDIACAACCTLLRELRRENDRALITDLYRHFDMLNRYLGSQGLVTADLSEFAVTRMAKEDR